MTTAYGVPPLTANRMSYCGTKTEKNAKMFVVFPSSPNVLYLKAGNNPLVHHYFTDIKHLCDRTFRNWPFTHNLVHFNHTSFMEFVECI